MDYFKKRLYDSYMVLTREAVEVPGNVPIPTVSSWNLMKRKNFTAPYLDVVENYYSERGDLQKKLLLVSDNCNMTLKVAALFADSENNEQDDDDVPWDDDDDYTEESYMGESVLLVDVPSLMNADKKELYAQMVVTNANSTQVNHILFTGAGIWNDWEAVLQTIAVCKVTHQYIEVDEKQLSLPAVQRLIYEYGFDIVHLPKLDKDYYEKEVLDVLLEQAPYELQVECGKSEWLRRLQKKRGHYFGEEDIAILLDMGVEHATKEGRSNLILKDFNTTISAEDISAWDRLLKLTGLDNLKDVAEEQVAFLQEQLENDKLNSGHEHMVFYGKPGTGKSTCAQLLADIFDEMGCGNGNFVVATRKDLIGEYVGHTAPKVAKCFEEARGGILFVDEAGFFLNKNSGGFVDEALKEFVRYMEQYEDVMVIFAMYPQEAKEFLQLDIGLSSRIKRCVEFKDYSEKELVQIAVQMFEENGYTLDKKSYSVIREYIRMAKEKEKEQFGNARSMRKLVETSIKEISLRHWGKKSERSNEKRREKDNRRITDGDLKNAIKKLRGIEAMVLPFGFQSAVGKRM